MFEISKATAADIKNGSITPADLVLEQTSTNDGRVWAIKTKAEASTSPANVATHVMAQGAEVRDLLYKTANGEPLPEPFKDLTLNQNFRVLSRSIPGLETAEHRSSIQESIKNNSIRVKGKESQPINALD